MRLKNILIIRPDAIGDVVLTIPLATALKAQFPLAKISMVVQEYVFPLLKGHPSIDRLIPDPKSAKKSIKNESAELRRHQFDCVFLPFMDGYYARLVKAADIPIRIGDANKVLLKKYLTHPVPLNYRDLSLHVVDQNLSLLKGLGIEQWDLPAMALHVTAKDINSAKTHMKDQGWKGETLIGIQPCTGGTDREWPTYLYVELINHLHDELGARVVLTGAGPREEAVISGIVSKCKHHPFTLIGSGTISKLKGLIHVMSVTDIEK